MTGDQVTAQRIPAQPIMQPPDRVVLEMDMEAAQILRIVLCQVADMTYEGRRMGEVWRAIHTVVPRDPRLTSEKGVGNRIIIRGLPKRLLWEAS